MHLRVEVAYGRLRDWTCLRPVEEGTNGSASSDTDIGRELYVFGWLPGEGGNVDGPGIWSSRGFDVDNVSELDGRPLRLVFSDELCSVGDLAAGPVEVELRRRSGGPSRTLRVTLVE